MSEASWQFDEGHEIAPGRTVLKSIGGGNMYEVHLVWEERMHAIERDRSFEPRDQDAIAGATARYRATAEAMRPLWQQWAQEGP